MGSFLLKLLTNLFLHKASMHALQIATLFKKTACTIIFLPGTAYCRFWDWPLHQRAYCAKVCLSYEAGLPEVSVYWFGNMNFWPKHGVYPIFQGVNPSILLEFPRADTWNFWQFNTGQCCSSPERLWMRKIRTRKTLPRTKMTKMQTVNRMKILIQAKLRRIPSVSSNSCWKKVFFPTSLVLQFDRLEKLRVGDEILKNSDTSTTKNLLNAHNINAVIKSYDLYANFAFWNYLW